MNKYLPTIGLEIHAELRTASKMFCSCKNDPDEEKPNANICPICLGHPGTLPVLNMEAIRHVLKIGSAVGGELSDFTEWDRKNYFYPDIPKGYQISQYKFPLVSGGSLAGVKIERIHLEEDTAQSTHDAHEKSLVNFNRAGVPLMELVTKPVIHDAETAVSFAKELQLLLKALGAGHANMEKGEMRVEANVSVAMISDTENGSKRKGTKISAVGVDHGKDANGAQCERQVLGTKTEVKNLNSFRAVLRAINFEIERQTSLLDHGGKVVQETRGWDDEKEETYSQRSKESSHDYRYFPEPDIPKLLISDVREFSPDAILKDTPELPSAKRERYGKDYGMSEKEIGVLLENIELSKYFESIISHFGNDARKIKLAVNYLLSDYLGILKSKKRGFHEVSAIRPSSFAELISMTASGGIGSRGAKELLAELEEHRDANLGELAKSMGLIQKSNSADFGPSRRKSRG